MSDSCSARFVVADTLDHFPASLRGGVVAIGNFDGVHRGHRAVLQQAIDIARAKNVPAYVLTFEPHPRSVFNPDAPVFRLTPREIKAAIMEGLGMNGMVSLPFTPEFAAIPADTFVQDILIEKLGVTHAVTGYDFHFGQARSGSPEFLSAAGAHHGFGVTIVPPEHDEGDNVISSSRIRSALGEGDISLANGLLGYRWFVEGEVRHGDQRGRDLGFPTANLAMKHESLLKYGIYAVRMKVGDKDYDGVASYGRRPTFDNGAPLLETFLFDFHGDLYGKVVRVTLYSYLREERKFDSVDALVTQMTRDSEEAKAALAASTPLSDLDLALSGQHLR